MPMARFLSVALLFLLLRGGVAHAQETAFTPVLVPLLTFPEQLSPGAHDSRWAAEAWFQYTGGEAVEVRPRTNVCIITCDQFREVLQPGIGPRRLSPDVIGDRGLLLYLPTDRLSDFTFHARVRDLSREASAGTTMPVVSERDFAVTAHILNVPLDADTRVSVRIYGLPEVMGPEVTVRYMAMPPDGQPELPPDVLREERVRLVSPTQSGALPFRPSYAMLSNIDDLPELSGKDSIWIQITAMPQQARIWAMVSVTDNVSQYVMLLWPQRL